MDISRFANRRTVLLKVLSAAVVLAACSWLLEAQEAKGTRTDGKEGAAQQLQVQVIGEVVIPVSDLDRSKSFYQRLGGEISDADSRHAVCKFGGLSVRMIACSKFIVSDYPVLVWRFNDVAEAKARLIGVVDRMESLSQIPGNGDFFKAFGQFVRGNFFKDPDGHIIAYLSKE